MPPLGSERALSSVEVNIAHVSPPKLRNNTKENIPTSERGSPLAKKRVSFIEHQTRRTETRALVDRTQEHPGFKEQHGIKAELTGQWKPAHRLEEDCNMHIPLDATPPRGIVRADPQLSQLYLRRPPSPLQFEILRD